MDYAARSKEAAFTAQWPLVSELPPPAVRRIIRKPYLCSTESPKIPSTYSSLYARASAAAARALSDGIRAGKIEFPPTPNLNRAGDGSRRSLREAAESNAKLVASLGDVLTSMRPRFIVFDMDMMTAIRAVAPKAAGPLDAVRWKGAESAESLFLDRLVVGVTPASDEEWHFLERIAERSGHGVLVANGLFRNGLDWLEPVFYVKPCSGWGTLIKDYPNPYEVVSAKSGEVLEHVSVSVLKQGRIRRQYLQTVSRELQRDFYT
jgi:hypothetical protein